MPLNEVQQPIATHRAMESSAKPKRSSKPKTQQAKHVDVDPMFCRDVACPKPSDLPLPRFKRRNGTSPKLSATSPRGSVASVPDKAHMQNLFALASPKQSASSLSQPPFPLSSPQLAASAPRLAMAPPSPAHMPTAAPSSSSSTSAAQLLHSMHQAAAPHASRSMRPAPPAAQADLLMQFQRFNVAVQP